MSRFAEGFDRMIQSFYKAAEEQAEAMQRYAEEAARKQRIKRIIAIAQPEFKSIQRKLGQSDGVIHVRECPISGVIQIDMIFNTVPTKTTIKH